MGYGVIDKLDVMLVHAFLPAGMQEDLKMMKLLSERNDPHAQEMPVAEEKQDGGERESASPSSVDDGVPKEKTENGTTTASPPSKRDKDGGGKKEVVVARKDVVTKAGGHVRGGDVVVTKEGDVGGTKGASLALSGAVSAPHSMCELFIFMFFAFFVFLLSWVLVYFYNPWFFHLPPYGPKALSAISHACADYDAQHMSLKEYPNRASGLWIFKLFSQLGDNDSPWTE